MDLLGSILSKMTPPPPLSENEKKLRQKNIELEKSRKESEKLKYDHFVNSIRKRLTAFDSDETQGPKLTFQPMTKPQRAVIHSESESLQLIPLSFGDEEFDRHVVVYRQYTVPSEPELQALKRNTIYVPTNEETTEEDSVQDTAHENGRKRKSTNQEPDKYLAKYTKVLGGRLEVAKDGAKSTCAPTRSYGYVSTELKSDRRTIEETLADIRARKK